MKFTHKKDEQFILESLILADQAKGRGDLPVGAVLVLPNTMLSESNTVWSENDLTNHAEINVMRKASQMGFRNLRNAILYSTVEPCPMCAAAAIEYGIKEVVFGAFDSEHGFTKIFKEVPFAYRGGVLAKECIELLPKYIQKNMREIND